MTSYILLLFDAVWPLLCRCTVKPINQSVNYVIIQGQRSNWHNSSLLLNRYTYRLDTRHVYATYDVYGQKVKVGAILQGQRSNLQNSLNHCTFRIVMKALLHTKGSHTSRTGKLIDAKYDKWTHLPYAEIMHSEVWSGAVLPTCELRNVKTILRDTYNVAPDQPKHPHSLKTSLS